MKPMARRPRVKMMPPMKLGPSNALVFASTGATVGLTLSALGVTVAFLAVVSAVSALVGLFTGTTDPVGVPLGDSSFFSAGFSVTSVGLSSVFAFSVGLVSLVLVDVSFTALGVV